MFENIVIFKYNVRSLTVQIHSEIYIGYLQKHKS